MSDRSESMFLEAYDASPFERPSLTIDLVLLTIRNEQLAALLIRRTEHPERGKWALPGGFIDVKQSLEENAQNVLEAKAGIRDVFLEQLYTFGAVDRDPRTRIITIAYYALVHNERLASLVETPDRCVATIRVPWLGEAGGPVVPFDRERKLDIAFDHRDIVGTAIKRLRGKLPYTPVGYELLPKRFTLLELQRVHEIISGAPVNKDSFRRRMLASGELEATASSEAGVGHRPATLYRLRGRKKYSHG